MDPGDRRAFERATITRAMERDCALFGTVEGGKIVFTWRSLGVQLGPDFASRDLAIDWMAVRLGNGDAPTDLES